MSLRPYQKKGLEEIKAHYRNGIKKVLLHMPTGSGKTVVFSEVLKGIYQKEKAGLIAVRGRKLVDQASKRLTREGVSHGVFMANHRMWSPNRPIQVCSIDTIRSRGILPKADLVIIDECDEATSPSFKNFLGNYEGCFMLGVTATPYGSKPLTHLADAIVAPITISELVSQGYLVDGRYYAPRTPDLSEVSTSKMTGDYVVEELEEVMSGTVIVADVVTEWLKLGQNRPTLAFCVSVDHSLQVCAAFNAKGVPAVHCDANVPDSVRDSMISRLESGEIKVICNIGTMTRGVDIPALSCGIMARPTQSYNLFVQMMGRFTRPFPGKDNFILLDHSGNLEKFGTLKDVDKVQASILGKKPKTDFKTRTCSACFAVFPQQPGACPFCGYVKIIEASEREFTTIDGELAEFVSDPIKRRFEELQRLRKLSGYKRGWIFHKMKDEFGEQVAEEFVPKRIIPAWRQ